MYVDTIRDGISAVTLNDFLRVSLVTNIDDTFSREEVEIWVRVL